MAVVVIGVTARLFFLCCHKKYCSMWDSKFRFLHATAASAV